MKSLNPGENPGILAPMRQQAHGGSLRSGGSNRGGKGRPRSKLAQLYRKSLEASLPVLEQIADDENARVTQRIQAIALLAKIGMRPTELDLHDVRARLRRTLDAIGELSDSETAARLLATLENIWEP